MSSPFIKYEKHTAIGFMLFSEQNHTFLCASTVFQIFKNSPTIILHFQASFSYVAHVWSF